MQAIIFTVLVCPSTVG